MIEAETLFAVFWMQAIVLPAVAVGLIAAAVAVRSGSRERTTIITTLAVLAADVWLWLIATTGPVGPVLNLFYLLVVAHGTFVMYAVQHYTGFGRRPYADGRYRSTRSPRGYRPGD